MCPKAPIDRDVIERIPYALSIRSIINVKLCITPYVSNALSITSSYQSIPGEFIGR